MNPANAIKPHGEHLVDKYLFYETSVCDLVPGDLIYIQDHEPSNQICMVLGAVVSKTLADPGVRLSMEVPFPTNADGRRRYTYLALDEKIWRADPIPHPIGTPLSPRRDPELPYTEVPASEVRIGDILPGNTARSDRKIIKIICTCKGYRFYQEDDIYNSVWHLPESLVRIRPRKGEQA